MKYKIFIFFTVGLILYLIDLALNSYDNKDIHISDQEITSLISAWKSQIGRNPNEDEIARIINNLVEEEILYREAINLGLDKEDRIIKRRMAQKISFLKQESIIDSPSNKDLQEYFNNNKEKYYIDSTFTFTHYYFSFENNSKERSQKAFKNLINNTDVNSDPFFLGKNFVNINLKRIKSEFGEEFGLFFNENIELNKWIEPIKSEFGHHIIYVSSYKKGYLPEITMVIQQVEVDFIQTKRDEAVKEFLKKVKPSYTIYINPNLQF